MSVTYKVTEPISVGQFIGLQADSMLGERRPIADRECLEGMLGATILRSVPGNQVGIARSITDLHDVCYLSDLTGSGSSQATGVGKQLQILTQ
ncbi:MAG: hypothetical protein R3E73_07670 [Porticoccaceae bacterium]|nr:hypothetical protein [Pseudomonadales bacterium]